MAMKQGNYSSQDKISRDIKEIGIKAGIITESPLMVSVFEHIASVAKSPQSILITGETGVGKELIAKSIHATSGVRGRMITVNVAGLDDNVFSDTLFGHLKGAFTGADKTRQGLIEKANWGTLFLDEIGDLSLQSQVKLLRLLQEGEYMPLGQDEPKHTNSRIITATNVNLWALQREGKFRKDLNFRLRTHHVNIPPLRDRFEDLPALINHFMGKAAKALNKKTPSFPKELVQLLAAYSFPGNIRELEAIIFDAVSRHTNKILSLDIFKHHIEKQRKETIKEITSETGNEIVSFSNELPTIRQATDILVKEAIKRAGGNQTIAAKMLGISRQALGKRIKNMNEQ